MDKRELDELSNAIETIKNYCKDLENEKQFLIKPEKDIDTEMQKVVKIADFVFKNYIQNKKYAM